MADEHAADEPRQARDAVFRAAFAWQAAHGPLRQAGDALRVAGEIGSISRSSVSRRHP